MVADSHPLHGARASRLDQHIGGGHQPAQSEGPVRMLEVERDRALATVDGVIDPRALGRGPDAVPAGSLHLDDLGTEIDEQQRATAAGEVPGQVEDAHVLKRP